jgi:hypothetical protein
VEKEDEEKKQQLTPARRMRPPTSPSPLSWSLSRPDLLLDGTAAARRVAGVGGRQRELDVPLSQVLGSPHRLPARFYFFLPDPVQVAVQSTPPTARRTKPTPSPQSRAPYQPSASAMAAMATKAAAGTVSLDLAAPSRRHHRPSSARPPVRPAVRGLRAPGRRVIAAPAAAAAAAAVQAGAEEIVLQPIKEISGTVKLPGSKSLSNRILLLAALSEVSDFGACCAALSHCYLNVLPVEYHGFSV